MSADRSGDGQDSAPKTSSGFGGFEDSAFGAPPIPAPSPAPIDNAAFASQPGLDQGPNFSLQDSFPVTKHEPKSGTNPFSRAEGCLKGEAHLHALILSRNRTSLQFTGRANLADALSAVKSHKPCLHSGSDQLKAALKLVS